MIYLCSSNTIQMKKNKRIIVSVTNDLVVDQRVHKVCTTLKQNGYEPVLVGRKYRGSLPVHREYRTVRMRLLFRRSFCFYAEYNFRLLLFLLFTRADIFLSNDTDSLTANYLASKIRRKPLIFDAHEMFPEVPEVTDRPFVKRFWTAIENWIFPHLKKSYTVCQSIAEIYNQRYSMDMKVIRNIPFAQNKPFAFENPPIQAQGKKILLYQGAVNIGRGIEWIMDAMPYLDDFVFYVLGDGDVLEELKAKAVSQNLEDQVIFTGRVPFEQLPAYTACADIGINLLENKGLNYYYSLPNRIFDFIRAEVPVLSVDFPEIRRIVSRYNTGRLIDKFDPQTLAGIIREMSVEPKNTAGFAQAKRELTWENESAILLELLS